MKKNCIPQQRPEHLCQSQDTLAIIMWWTWSYIITLDRTSICVMLLHEVTATNFIRSTVLMSKVFWKSSNTELFFSLHCLVPQLKHTWKISCLFTCVVTAFLSDALPTELWSHTLGARSIYWVHIFPCSEMMWSLYEIIHFCTSCTSS